jgi:hypothetical protein
VTKVWRDDFLWSATSFMVAGTAGAIAAIIVARGEHWSAMLMLAPVHLTYRTYGLFIGRLDDQCRHAAEAQRLHQQTVSTLDETRRAERELAEEKRRLALALVGLARLETARQARAKAARASANGRQLKDQFLAIVPRAPHAAERVLGWADSRGASRIGDAQRPAALIDRGAKRRRLIDDLLDVARIMSVLRLTDRGRPPGSDPDAAGGQRWRRQARDHGRRRSARLIYADASRLQQVVRICCRTCQFTPAAARSIPAAPAWMDVERWRIPAKGLLRLSAIGLRGVSQATVRPPGFREASDWASRS